MPLYEYKAQKAIRGCSYCAKGFELLQSLQAKPLKRCPRCMKPIKKIISSVTCGSSKSTLDNQAKNKGFHKLKRVDKGKYEKVY